MREFLHLSESYMIQVIKKKVYQQPPLKKVY